MGRGSTWLLCLCLTLLSNAQDGATDRAMLLQRSAAVRVRMLADSMPMNAAQVDTLQAMAARAKGTAAIRFLQQALVMADSIREPTRERDILEALSAAYERNGHAGDALIATRAAQQLSDSLTSVARAQALEEMQAHQEVERQQWERAKVQHDQDMQAQRDAMQQLRERLQLTYGVSGALIAMLLLVLSMFLLSAKRKQSATGRVEPVAPDAPLRKNALRPSEPAVALGPVSEPTANDVRPAPDADDEVLLSLFRKRMPERLQVLKEARGRGDHEKVLRVLMSIRPQLIHHDAERFTERCTRLIAAGGRVLEDASQDDLGRLIADVERALGMPSSAK